MTRLPPLKGLLIDLDGVVYHGDHSLAGAAEFFRFLRAADMRFLLTTNNSTLRPSQYVEKLARMSIEVSESEVLGSAGATARYLQQTALPGSRVFVIGEEGLRSAIAEAGFELAERDVAYVVVGLDRAFDYRKLTLAIRGIRAGASFIGPNPDTTLPMPDGLIPGAGTLQAAITAATGVTPLVIGKPEPTMLAMGTQLLGCAPHEVAIVGDRLDTDIAGGQRAGLITILVLTGVARESDLDDSPVRPDFVFSDLSALMRRMKASDAR
ncbi:MAG TPA: HAD-IIA family hydrolase [Chloroflexota bacterium]|nr:HAD-IIA family hydrolase [Chloroflexota bacterium]